MQDEMKGHWLTPAIATLIVGSASLFITGLVALTYTPLRNDIDMLQREVAEIKADPRPRPEAKIRLDAIDAEHDVLRNRLDRLEERISNLHIFIMQVMPPARPGTLPLRKSELPTFMVR